MLYYYPSRTIIQHKQAIFAAGHFIDFYFLPY